ncbi:hypothetical protein Hanom_Chr06g00514691 [Helianthus anomalus]
MDKYMCVYTRRRYVEMRWFTGADQIGSDRIFLRRLLGGSLAFSEIWGVD